ncbi:MAG: ATP-dependent RecD-like DNA helicase [Puniceicoccales bacterium]|nr:ATP-dependent RecD-like DNA helicase [Puniceicoccales bacterium]
MTENVKCTLERIVFRNDESFFSIMEMREEDNGQQIFTARGKVPGVNCGETLVLTGSWTEHPKFGRQFAIESFSSALPADVKGIRKYLGSGLIQGIGKVYADKIVDYFGADTFDIISTEAARLREIPGIGAERARNIKAAWDEQYALRDMLIFLQSYNIPNALCLRLHKIYGKDAKQILQSDPYRVAREVDGIGFKTADKIAQNLGIPGNHISRIDAGILFTCSNLEIMGHTAYPRATFLALTRQLLEIGEETIADRLEKLIQFKKINNIGGDLIQTSAMTNGETTLAKHIHRLHAAPSSLPHIIYANAIAWAQKREGFPFADEQITALQQALAEKLSIITGGPGTGKTTILRALVAILSAKNIKIGLAAPTGRAAQKLTETTGIEAKTIHRLLQFNPQTGQFSFNEDNRLPFGYIIVDEASMIDTRLAVSLFNAIADPTHLLLVGDIDQLPSVGAGNILADFIASQRFHVTYLRQIFRQGQHSEIVRLAHAIITGDAHAIPDITAIERIHAERDFNFILANSPEECTQKVEQLCTEILPALYKIDPISDIQVLAPLHRGSAGIDALNERLQRAISGAGKQIPWCHFRLGDKVIQLRNNYEKNIFNGDLGIIYNFDSDGGTISVKFNGESVALSRVEVGDIALAYAISIHKSQGSEFPIVVIPLVTQHYVMLQRNLLYTAVTRGRNKVFIVGDPRAYDLAIGNKKSVKRITGLGRYFEQSPSEAVIRATLPA